MGTRWYWRCALSVMIVCLSLILMASYFDNLFLLKGTRMPLPFHDTQKEISRFFKKSLHLDKYLDQNCYHYKDLKARFTCGGPFSNFTKERIFDCAWKLWKDKSLSNRNPKEVDPWQNETPKTNLSASDVARRSAVHIMFIGDSHIRYIFEVFAKRILNQNTKYNDGVSNEWKDIQVMRRQKDKLVQEILSLDVPLRITFKQDRLLEKLPSSLESWILGEEPRPTFLVFGTALHYMRATKRVYQAFGPKRASEKYANQLRVLAPLVEEFAKRTSSVFKLLDHLQKHRVNTITNNKNIDLYNSIARETLAGDHLVLWDSAQPLSDLYNEECRKRDRNTPETYMWICEDKRHIGYVMIERYLDMYLNAICNN